MSDDKNNLTEGWGEGDTDKTKQSPWEENPSVDNESGSSEPLEISSAAPRQSPVVSSM